MARMTENRKKKRQRLSGTADTEALHTSETPVTSKLDSKVPQQSVDGDVKMRDATEESKPERVLRPRSKESPLEVSPEHSKKAQTDEHGNRVVDTLLSLQQLKESERHEEKGDPNMKALPHLPAKVSGRHVVGSEPRDLSITGKQPTSPTQLDSLKTYIENLGGVLEDGWHVDAQRSNSGRLIKTFISPSKERFRSRVEVAKHMGLSTNQAKNSQLASTHLQSNSQMISRQIDCENTQGKKATGDGVTLGKRLLEGPNIHVHSQDHSKLDFAGQSKKDRSFIPAQSHGKAVLNTNASATLASDTMKKMEDVSKLHVASTKSPSASFITQRCQDALRSIISTDNFAALSNMLNRGSPSGSLEATLQLKAAPLVARSLDLQLIHLRLSTGAYGQTPELFSADIQQVWKNIISAGNELVTLAHSLSELSDNLYKQQIMSLFQDPSGERVTSSSAIPSKEMSEGKEPLPLSSQHGKESIDHNGLSLHKSQISEENLVVPPSKKTPARPIDILEMGTSGEEVTPSESTPERPANTLDKGSSGQEITLATHEAVQSSSQEFNFHSKKAAAKSRPQKSKKRPKNASKSTSPQALRVVIADNTTASVCKKCGLEQGTECILCEQCSAGYHTHCIDSTSNSLAASGWCCPSCMSKEFMESPCTGILDKGAVVKETREELFLMSSDATSETSRELLKTTGKAGVCEACKKEDDSVLLCDACDAAYHMNCLTPAIDSVPDGYWYCPTCVEEQKKSVVSHEDANHTDVHNCSVCDRISRDSLLPTENESAEHLDFKDTPPVHILGKVSLEQSVEHGCEEHSVEHGCEERSVEHGSPEPSAENGSPELAFLLENENACKVCGIESKKSAVSCSGCLKRYHLSCLKPSLKKLPRRTWYCPSCLCRTCKIDADDDKILLCDACDEGYHTYCLNPPLAEIPEGAWFCPSCAKSKNMVPNSPRQTEVSKRKRKSTEPRRSI